MKTYFYTVLAVFMAASFNFAQAKEVTAADVLKKGDRKSYAQSTGSVSFDSGINKHSLGIGVGETFLLSDFKDSGENKITGDVYYSYMASYSFDFVANLHVSKAEFQSDPRFKPTSVTTPGLALGIKSRLYQFDSFAPYILGGMGFYRPTMTRVVETSNGAVRQETDGKLTFGYHIAAGCELKLNNKVTVGLVGHYHNPFDVKQEFGPEIEGSYFKLLMTAMYTFN